MAWHAQLQLDYSRPAARTQMRHRHQGPLRILKSLYPEGDAICHNVLVHPPGGLVGGARLEWLPQEAICYSGCLAENRLEMDLAPGAELIGWDITALGLPARMPSRLILSYSA